MEGFGERARSTYITGERFQEVPIERRTFGGFAEVRQDLGARASVSAGLRADAIRRNALEGDPNPFGPRPAFADESVTSVNPRLAGRFVAWQDRGGVARTTVRASFGTGIRPPDAFELAFTDNPALKPERSRSADIGVSHVLLPQLTVEATAFFNRYDDLIVAVGGSFADASRYRTDNISNARARGLELESAWRGPHGVHARLAYTWMSTEILAVDQSGDAPPPFTVGDPLIRRPRNQGAVDLGWTAIGVFRVHDGPRPRRGARHRAVVRHLRRPVHRRRLHGRRCRRQLARHAARGDLRTRPQPARSPVRGSLRLPGTGPPGDGRPAC